MNPVHAQRQTRSMPQEGATAEHQHQGISTAMLERMAYPYDLPALPYSMDALSPCISERTLRCHHGEHHKAYIEALNKAIGDTEYEAMPLKALILATAGKPGQSAIFNNAAQAWNHAFYWDSLAPEGGGEPPPVLKRMIEASFGSVEACRNALIKAATTQFGSGWAWLAQDGKKVTVLKTGNADNPMTRGMNPLLAVDVWEHAYYIDYQNRRKDHVDGVIYELLNWEFAASNLA